MEASAADRVERIVGLLERIELDLGAHRYLWGQRHELLAVAASEVGDGSEHALAPELLVGKTGNVAHVDAGADDPRPLRAVRQRRGHQRADRGEDDRAVDLFGGRIAGR